MELEEELIKHDKIYEHLFNPQNKDYRDYSSFNIFLSIFNFYSTELEDKKEKKSSLPQKFFFSEITRIRLI